MDLYLQLGCLILLATLDSSCAYTTCYSNGECGYCSGFCDKGSTNWGYCRTGWGVMCGDPCYNSLGYYCTSSTATPSPCPKNYYCPGNGAFECAAPCLPSQYEKTPCTATSNRECPSCVPNSTYCENGTVQTPCTLCNRGQYVQTACTTIKDRTCAFCSPEDPKCPMCPPGYYCPLNSTTYQPCEAGMFCPNGTTSLPCPAGYTCAACSSIATAKCSPGQYCPPKSVYAKQCPKGYACPDGASQIQCPRGTLCPPLSTAITPCPPNSVCADFENYVPCIITPPGQYSVVSCNTTVNTVFTRCLGNMFCLGGANPPQNCSTCSKGYYISSQCTSTTDTVCVPCEAGYFCSSGVTKNNCTSCIMPVFGTKSPCNATADAVCYMRNFLCLPCTADKVCLTGVKPPAQCSVALPGYYHFKECRPTNDTVIFACPKGKYCLGAFSPPQTCTTVCPLQQYMTSPCVSTSDAVCAQCTVTCPAGFYRTSPCNATSNLKCAACPAGSWCGDQHTIKRCSPGDYCLAGMSRPLLCPAGFQCANVTSKKPCTLGYFCPEGTVTPIPCPRPEAKCDLGLECPTFTCPAGSSAPVPCPSSGYTCPNVTMDPVPCDKYGTPGYEWLDDYACGYRCNSDGYYLNLSSQTCTRCSAYLTCSPGTYARNCSAFSDFSCEPCPAPCGNFTWLGTGCYYNCTYYQIAENVCALFPNTTQYIATTAPFIELNLTNFTNATTTTPEETTSTTPVPTTTTTPEPTTTTPEPTTTVPETTALPLVYPRVESVVEVANTTTEICDNQASFTQSYNQALETVSNLSFATVIATLDGQECTPEGICWACYPISRRRHLLQAADIGVQLTFTSMATVAVAVELAPVISPDAVMTSFVSDMIAVLTVGTSQVSCLDNAYFDYCDQLIIEATPPPVAEQPATASSSLTLIVGITVGACVLVVGAVVACLLVKPLKSVCCPCV